MKNLIYYRKNKNDNLFNTLENSIFQVNNLQNYIPLYENFFSFHESNYKNLNLNNKYYLSNIDAFYDEHSMTAIVVDNSNNTLKRDVFCKFSPLLDPLKYLTGKYDCSNNSISLLPDYTNTNANTTSMEDHNLSKSSPKCKIEDKNNSAYVDGFFSYLSSVLLHNFGLINSIDFYGSYLCNQSKFLYDISDDIDYLDESSYFHQEKNKKYEIDSELYSSIFNTYSRCNKTKLSILEKTTTIDTDNINEILDIYDSYDVSNSYTRDMSLCELTTNNIEMHSKSNELVDLSDICVYKQLTPNAINTLNHKSITNSSCSSKSSHTTDSNDNADDSDEYETIDDDSESNSESDDDDGDESEVMCNIFDFPVELIAIEKCTNTLDSLMGQGQEMISHKEWSSCLFQIIITLSAYQQTYSFTHNDLHTNNIMYVETEKKFIYYKFNNIYYKVPTYGKIYKIIDFGRSIYKVQGKIICSDSFHPKGDAGSQYNCEPYFDKSKPRLEPNYSFDLCRLACCLFDDFVDDISDLPKLLKNNKILDLIHTWLIDDKNRNILYKTNGDERYPEFKLYKMIARTIHNAIPRDQLNHKIFADYIIGKKNINKKQKIVNIDSIPCMN